MKLSPNLRKLALSFHILTSAGLLGAIGCFLVLSIAGLHSTDGMIVRTAYLAMNLTTWSVIAPLAIAALITGTIQSIATPWGLFRHYWVVAKLALTLLATIVMLLKLPIIVEVASAAASGSLEGGALFEQRMQLTGHAHAGLLVLLVPLLLSVYKPFGRIPLGNRA